MSSTADGAAAGPDGAPGAGAVQSATPRRDRSHWLYIAVIIAVVLGALVGGFFPETGVALKPVGDGFVDLIQMMISPVIFCTIVLGIGSIAKAATVGRVGLLALVYFIGMSTFALAIGLVVGNLINPGSGLDVDTTYDAPEGSEGGTVGFLLDLIPTTLVSPLTGDSVLSTLFVALLVGTVLLVGLLNYVPALALGPVVEHLMLWKS